MLFSTPICKRHGVLGDDSSLSHRIFYYCADPTALILRGITGPGDVATGKLAPFPPVARSFAEYMPTTTLFKVWVSLYRYVHKAGAERFPGKDVGCIVRADGYTLMARRCLATVHFSYHCSTHFCEVSHADLSRVLTHNMDCLSSSFHRNVHEPDVFDGDVGEVEFGTLGPFSRKYVASDLEAGLAIFRERLSIPSMWSVKIFDDTEFTDYGNPCSLQVWELEAFLRQ